MRRRNVLAYQRSSQRLSIRPMNPQGPHTVEASSVHNNSAVMSKCRRLSVFCVVILFVGNMLSGICSFLKAWCVSNLHRVAVGTCSAVPSQLAVVFQRPWSCLRTRAILFTTISMLKTRCLERLNREKVCVISLFLTG